MTPACWELLKSYRSANVFNPWGESDPWQDLYTNSHVLRVRRLAAHLDCNARYLLIGEAPGYQGCRWSGVPFTSERLLIEGKIPRASLEMAPAWRITQRQASWAEPSATIVWKALRELGIHDQTVMWNAFPWHPHKSGNPYSNRTPTESEMFGVFNANFSAALLVLNDIIRAFPSAVIVSVGKLSDRACPLVTDRYIHRVRHPANGGATLFRQQLAKIVSQ